MTFGLAIYWIQFSCMSVHQHILRTGWIWEPEVVFLEW